MFDPNKNISKHKLLIWLFILSQIFLNPSSTWALNATSFTPADNATGVSVSANLSISFDYGWYSENSGSIKIYYANGSLFESYAHGSGRISGEGSSTLTIDPTTDLTGSSSYYVQIDSNRIRDNYWMYYSISNSTTWNFSTAAVSDTTPPSLVKLRPADNTTQVLRDQNLVMTFSENIDLKSGNILIKKLSDNSTVETISVTGGAVTGNGTTIVTINPTSNLNFNNGYYITIANGVIADTAGNNYAGFSTNGTWNFRSETNGSWYDTAWLKRIKITTDATTVNGTQTNFPVYVDLSNFPSTFFDDVYANGKDIRVTMSNGSTLVPHEVVALSKTANTGELHFKAPTAYGADNTAFYIYYKNSNASTPSESGTYGAQNVWNGNSYVGVWHLNEDPDTGISKDSGKYSTNGTPANMSSEDPVTGQVGNALDFDGSSEYISMRDVSSVNFGSGDYSLSAWFKTDDINTTQVIIGKDTSGSRQFELRTDSSRYVRSSYWDVSQNWIYRDTNASFVADTNWHYVVATRNGNSFEIYKDGALYTSGTSGGTHATMADATATLRIAGRQYAGFTNEFNGRIDEVRMASTSHSSSWINTEYNNQYSPSTFYNISSISQNSPPDVTNPTLSSLSPTDGATGVLIDTNLIMTFSETIDIQSGNVVIKKFSDNSTVQTISVTSGSVTGNGTTSITINPTDLDYNTAYYVTVDASAFDDNSGNSYAGFSDNGTWNFTTGGEAWYDSNWLYRKPITILHSKVNGDLTDFPVLINLNDMGGDFFDAVQSDGGDIVMTGTDKTTKLSRELEYINITTNQGLLWFKAPNLYNTSNSTFYMYYGYGAANETNDTSTWRSSYKVVNHLQETPTSNNSDSEFQDSTSNNNDVQSKGTMTSADKIAGQIGNGVDLDGTDDYLNFGNVSSIDGKPKFTLSAWIKPNNPNSVLPVFSKGNYSVIDIMHDTSSWRACPSLDAAYHYRSQARNTNWTYLVAVFDSTLSGNNRFQMYINGNPLTLTYSTIYTNSGGESASLTAGFQNTTSYSGYYGGLKFDEIRVSNGSYSAAWVKTEYANQKTPGTFYTIGTEEEEGGGGGDVTAPTVSSFSPLDGATGVAVDTNLIINFDETIDTQSGNITIKKLSDNSTVATIAIGSVTGNGTSSITINPSSDLLGNTSYYVNVDATAVDDTAGNSYAGISNNGTWNFTTGAITGWMNDNWTKRVKITVDDSRVNGSVYNFPVYVKLDNLSTTGFFNNTRSDGGDIRVTQGDGLTQLPLDLAYYDATNNMGEMHFRAPYLSSTSNLDFYIYYGNSNARPLNAADTLGAQSVWSNGFVAVYHLQDNPNGDVAYTVRNSKSNKYHGTPYGSMTKTDRVAGQLGNGTDFDGSNDYISTADISEIDGATKLTYSMWFKRRSSGNYVVMGKGGSGSSINMTDIHIWNDGNIYYQYRSGGSTYGTSASNDTNWHHFVSVYNGSGATNADKVIGYLDGSAQSISFSGTIPSSLSSNTGSFLIGKRNLDATYTNGLMDEIRVANKLRNRNWMITEYNNQNSPSTFYTVEGTVGVNTDSSKPQITSTIPANHATQVPIRANLVINFNENISASSGNIVIKRASNGSTFETIAIGSTTISGSTITINPSSNFASNTTYYITLDSGIVVDGSANPFTGLSSNQGWRFTTTGSHSKETIMHGIGF